MTPARDSPAIPRLRSVNSYTNIRTASSTRNLNKSLQNLNLNEEGETHLLHLRTKSVHHPQRDTHGHQQSGKRLRTRPLDVGPASSSRASLQKLFHSVDLKEELDVEAATVPSALVHSSLSCL